jgi:hypothetical protein
MVNPMRWERVNLETENALDCSGIFKIQEDALCQTTI